MIIVRVGKIGFWIVSLPKSYAYDNKYTPTLINIIQNGPLHKTNANLTNV